MDLRVAGQDKSGLVILKRKSGVKATVGGRPLPFFCNFSGFLPIA
jgi:hypothetical protein